VIDISDKMAGAKIEVLNSIMEQSIYVLRDMDEDSADLTLEIAVLEFSNGARWLTPYPINVKNFCWNDLSAGGACDFGRACEALNEKLSKREFIPRWTPFFPNIFLISAGEPTDDYVLEFDKLKNNPFFYQATKFALAVGTDSNEEMLANFTGNEEAVCRVTDGVNTDRTLRKMIHFNYKDYWDELCPDCGAIHDSDRACDCYFKETKQDAIIGVVLADDTPAESAVIRVLSDIKKQFGEDVFTKCNLGKFMSLIRDSFKNGRDYELINNISFKVFCDVLEKSISIDAYFKFVYAQKKGNKNALESCADTLYIDYGIAKDISCNILEMVSKVSGYDPYDDWW
jgi:uncharacterized protein YegL